MNFEKPLLETLKNESDVEQKFIYQLLVADSPFGLGHHSATIATKKTIRSFLIGKGKEEKSYIPDYIITCGGYPIVIIEAKTPGSDVYNAFREARLYANELNCSFSGKRKPVTRILASDALLTLAGFHDQLQPLYKMDYSEIDSYSEQLRELIAFCGKNAVEEDFRDFYRSLRPKRFWNPRRLTGGLAVQREEVALNSFGATISADFTTIFNPQSPEDRAHIVKNGYISSKRRERYIQPIDRIIRAASPPSETDAAVINDSSNPREVIKIFRDRRPLEHKILLILGSAGSGKTTFVDYLQEVALPNDVRVRTAWLRIDMNPAPISRTEIYDWLRKQIISITERALPKIDFNSLEVIESVHADEVNKFKKGLGRLYQPKSSNYNVKLAEILERAENDLHKKAMNYSKFLASNGQKLLIFVLDNSDKRLRDEQLLMFEAAQWLQNEFRGLIILPLREETYDSHRGEPPLDTALKDLVFRIEPPLFQRVLQSRVQMALKSVEWKGGKKLRYNLPNGMVVEYSASDQSFYLASIMRSVFEYDNQIRRLIVGLAGRNIRRALEIFLEFCTSGHIGEDQFIKIKQAQGQYALPFSLVMTILLRLNQRYYNNNHAYLKNILSADERDERPHYFVRLMILRLLKGAKERSGSNRLQGYVSIREISEALYLYGVAEKTLQREVEVLASGLCITSEDFKIKNLSEADLVCIAPAGFVHLEMISNVYYLSAVAEDTWFAEKAVAESISNRIKRPSHHHSNATILANAIELSILIKDENEKEVVSYTNLSKQNVDLLDISQVITSVSQFERSNVSAEWIGVAYRFRPGIVYPGKIVGITNFGIFVELSLGIVGLAHVSDLQDKLLMKMNLKRGDDVRVEVLEIDETAAKAALKMVM